MYLRDLQTYDALEFALQLVLVLDHGADDILGPRSALWPKQRVHSKFLTLKKSLFRVETTYRTFLPQAPYIDAKGHCDTSSNE